MTKTGYFTHPDCRRHEMGPGHPECPERLDAIEDRLLASGVGIGLDRRLAPEASVSDIELAHTRMHVAAMRGLRQELKESIAAGGRPYSQIDPDTSMNEHTWQAALHAAGAVLAATDAVMAGDLENAFCAVRPPGHHACRDKAMGFCFFNNVAIAAMHALEQHGLERVAIADFDVHHGNGTEAVFGHDERVQMVGTFQHPFYPYSGTEDTAPNMANVPLAAGTGSHGFREAVDYVWLPALERFKPQMIFISAGFDAHVEDDMAMLRFTEADYAWVTEKLKAIAERYAEGRIVSVLEGGYALSALGRSVVSHLRVLGGL